jgi:hypothetical protein
MAELAVSEQELANRIYIGPNKTGDNISADRAANYGWDGANWQRQPLPYVPFPYDYIGVNTSGSTTDVYTFYEGGSGGTLVSTITITYSDATKSSMTSVART